MLAVLANEFERQEAILTTGLGVVAGGRSVVSSCRIPMSVSVDDDDDEWFDVVVVSSGQRGVSTAVLLRLRGQWLSHQGRVGLGSPVLSRRLLRRCGVSVWYIELLVDHVQELLQE